MKQRRSYPDLIRTFLVLGVVGFVAFGPVAAGPVIGTPDHHHADDVVDHDHVERATEKSGACHGTIECSRAIFDYRDDGILLLVSAAKLRRPFGSVDYLTFALEYDPPPPRVLS